MDTRRTTAPLPKIKTVLVDSEKGSRLSLPATVRAPFTVTATSSATGCGRDEVSPDAALNRRRRRIFGVGDGRENLVIFYN